MSNYRRRRCARCGEPVNQRAEEAMRGEEPLCREHAREKAAQQMSTGFAGTYAQIARETIARLRQCGIRIPDNIATEVVEWAHTPKL